MTTADKIIVHSVQFEVFPSTFHCKMPFEVKNELVIITGSAQGFGKEFAKRLLKKGAKVCLSDVNSELGEKTLEELGKIYGAQNVTFKR